MARSQIQNPLTADGRSDHLTIKNTPRQNGSNITKTVFVTGTFGSGTATLQASIDSGVTWFDVTNASGAVEFTENSGVNIDIASDPQNPVIVAINLAGATSPNLILTVFDAS